MSELSTARLASSGVGSSVFLSDVLVADGVLVAGVAPCFRFGSEATGVILYVALSEEESLGRGTLESFFIEDLSSMA